MVTAYADLALHSGAAESAGRLLGAAFAVRAGPDRSTVDAGRVERTARERLGEERFAETFEAGRSSATGADVRDVVRFILDA